MLEPSIIDLIEGDQTVFEKEPLVEAARMGQLNAYRHKGFWQCMDTLRERIFWRHCGRVDRLHGRFGNKQNRSENNLV